jgi:hypothetical protein
VCVTTPEQDQITAEYAVSFYSVKYQHSYLSHDSGNALITKVFLDSKRNNKFKCGHIKSESLVDNLLGPHSDETALY